MGFAGRCTLMAACVASALACGRISDERVAQPTLVTRSGDTTVPVLPQDTLPPGDSSTDVSGIPSAPQLLPPAETELKGTVLDPHYSFVPGMEQNLALMSRRFPVVPSAEVAVLADADAFLSTRIHAIRVARHSIRLQTFIYSGDEVGRLFTSELCAASQRGVKTSILVDDKINIQRASQRMFEDLLACGAKVEGYEKTFFRAFDLLFGREGALTSFELFNKRYHDKILVVDAEDPPNAIGFAGGTNVANEYFQITDGPSHNWRDQDVAVRGTLAVAMAGIFDENFADHARLRLDPQLARKDSFWNVVFAHRLRARNYDDVSKEVQAADNYAVNADLAALARRKANAIPKTDWRSATAGRFLQSRPRRNEPFIIAAYLDLIASAKSEIVIFNSYFIPTAEIQTALITAVERGVRVRLATNGPTASDLPIVQTAGRSFFHRLMRANGRGAGEISIYEWRAHGGLKNGMGTHHGKYAVFDSSVVAVGSYNLDPRSQFLNSETLLLAHDPVLAAQLTEIFDYDTSAEFAVAISADEALRFAEPRSFLAKLRTDFANRFLPLLF